MIVFELPASSFDFLKSILCIETQDQDYLDLSPVLV